MDKELKYNQEPSLVEHEATVVDRRLEVFKTKVWHLRGALWWAHNDLIKRTQRQFNDHHL